MKHICLVHEPLIVWNKELEGPKEKISVEDMYPAAPKPVSEYLYLRQGSKKNILKDASVVVVVRLLVSKQVRLSESHAKQ